MSSGSHKEGQGGHPSSNATTGVGGASSHGRTGTLTWSHERKPEPTLKLRYQTTWPAESIMITPAHVPASVACARLSSCHDDVPTTECAKEPSDAIQSSPVTSVSNSVCRVMSCHVMSCHSRVVAVVIAPRHTRDRATTRRVAVWRSPLGD